MSGGAEREDPFARLARMRAAASAGGGEARIERQHREGKLTARERIDLLFDPGSFVEIDRYVTHRCDDFGMADKKVLGDGVVTGAGRVEGRPVFVYAQDFTVLGGTVSGAHAEKICKVLDLATRNGAPVVALKDSGGARIQESIAALQGYADVFMRNVLASGVVPQITAIMGPCAGGAVYSPASTDLVVMVEGTSYMFVTSPQVIKAVMHVDVTKEALGGAEVQTSRSGVAHFAVPDDRACLRTIRELLSFLPSNNAEDPPRRATDDPIDRQDAALDTLVPPDAGRAYDMRTLIAGVVDDRHVVELQPRFAPNMITALARLDGQPVGIVANQPLVLAGAIDIDAATKAARFVRFCDCYNLPIVTLVDVPGFLPGTEQEYGGIIRHGAKMIFAYGEATVPKVTIVARKAYGGAYVVMGSKHLRADFNFAFPTAEIAVMGPQAAVDFVFKDELARAEDPEAERAARIEHYRRELAHPYRAASWGAIDDVIRPSETRPTVIRALRIARDKRDVLPPKKHSNLPL